MDLTPEVAPAAESSLQDLPADDIPPAPDPFYQRPAWRKAFVAVLVVAVWLVIGLVFSPAYFRF